MNKTTLITGASSGIGLEFAHILAEKKHNLILVARRIDALNKLKKELENKYGISVFCIEKDLSISHAAQEIKKELQEKNISVDILINNAGFGQYGLFTETDGRKESEMIQLNITALTELTKLFLGDMVAKKSGRILNVASTAAFQPGPLMAVYFATKAYVLSFSEAIGRELMGSGVTVTCLCPGPTKSEFSTAASMENIAFFANRNLPTSRSVAEIGYKAMMKGQAVVVAGKQNLFLTMLVRFVPRRLVTKVVFGMQR